MDIVRNCEYVQSLLTLQFVDEKQQEQLPPVAKEMINRDNTHGQGQ